MQAGHALALSARRRRPMLRGAPERLRPLPGYRPALPSGRRTPPFPPRDSIMRTPLLLLALLLAPAAAHGQAWLPDAGNGQYRNPIIFEDFSDPDVIRVGDDFYMTASSFDQVPGLPILHSTDLVHWTIVNYALPRLPDPAFDQPQHG